MKMVKYLLTALLVVGFAATVYAAPIGLTSEADATEGELWADNNISLSVGAIYDAIGERSIDVNSGEFEMQAFMARIGLGMLDRLNLYVDIGQTTEPELSYTAFGENHVVSYDEDFIWGIGLSGLIYRWDNGIEIGANASYRQAELGLDSVTLDGTQHRVSPAGVRLISDDDFTEWQVAAEVAWKAEALIPYVGVKYSDVELGSDYTINGQQYSASKGKSASKNLGLFLGVSITPKLASLENSDQFSINIEGRLIDEEAMSVGIAYKF